MKVNWNQMHFLLEQLPWISALRQDCEAGFVKAEGGIFAVMSQHQLFHSQVSEGTFNAMQPYSVMVLCHLKMGVSCEAFGM